MNKIKVLQFGIDDLSTKYKLQEGVTWFYEPDITEYPERDYEVAIIQRPITKEEAQYIFLYIRAYCLFIMEDVQLSDDTKWIVDSKVGETVNQERLKQLVETELTLYYSQSYGEQLRPTNFEISPNYIGEIVWSGFSGVTLEADFGREFKQIAFWRNTIPLDVGNFNEFWLEYEKDPSVEIEFKITKIVSGTVSTVEKVNIYSEEDLKNIIVLESKTRTLAFMSVSARGKGKLKLISLHNRLSRNGKGNFIPGGQRKVTDTREELFWYFDPGDLKPPLNVYFSGYKTQEGFEGLYMMRNMGAPFVLISEPRLEGGAFYLGSNEYEHFVVEVINDCLKKLGFDSSQLILSGLSMGTFGAMYFGAELKPHAIILGKPLASLGAVAANERINRPGGFPTSLDVAWKQYGSIDKDALILLNKRFWSKFDSADWSHTKFEIAYMIEDDYDSNAYMTILNHIRNSGVSVYGKGLHGRHNDNTPGIVQWYVKQYYKTLAIDFGRKPLAKKYKEKGSLKVK